MNKPLLPVKRKIKEKIRGEEEGRMEEKEGNSEKRTGSQKVE